MYWKFRQIHIKVCLVSVFFFLIGCMGNPLEQSITEQFALNEINAMEEQYPGFRSLYDEIDHRIRFCTDGEKSLFMNVTYQQCYDYDKTIRERDAQWNEEAEDEWNRKFGNLGERVDSVIESWELWEKENCLEKKIKMEPVAFVKPEYGSTKIIIQVTSLIGELDGCHGVFAIDPKGETSGVLSHAFSYGMGGMWNQVVVEEPFTTITMPEREFLVNFAYDGNGHESDLYTLPLNEVLEKYDFSYQMIYIIKNGEKILHNKHLNEIPSSVIHMQSNRNGTSPERYELYQHEQDIIDVAKEILKIEYIPQDTYKLDYVEKQKYLTDSIAYNFFQLKYRL